MLLYDDRYTSGAYENRYQRLGLAKKIYGVQGKEPRHTHTHTCMLTVIPKTVVLPL